MGIEAWTAVGSLIVAAVALLYPWLKDRRRNRECLHVTVERLRRPYPIAWGARSRSDPTRQLYIITQWECVLINTGSKGVSVTHVQVPDDGKNVLPFNDAVYSTETPPGEGDVDKIRKGLWRLMPDKKIRLPVNIAPDGCERFIIKIGLAIEREVQGKLQEALNAEEIDNDMLEVFAFLREHQLSLLRNGTIEKLHPVYFLTARHSRFCDVIALGDRFKRVIS